MNKISGFSKLSKVEKIEWLKSQVASDDQKFLNCIESYWHPDSGKQKLFDEFSENTVSNFIFPYGLAPNFSINDKIYTIPLVIEESSVVAAASKSAKFWLDRGGFKTRVLSTNKVGHIHFIWKGDKKKLFNFFNLNKSALLFSVKDLVSNMEKRGGGVVDLVLKDKTSELDNYFQVEGKFETCDAMGANFINSVLEVMAGRLQELALEYESFSDSEKDLEVVMSILSNYTPECVVSAYVECPVSELGDFPNGMNAEMFAKRFERAVKIAKVDISRAVTHNKGIFNGIDAVVVATGNDFRAIEACGHAYAARDGQYRGLSSCTLDDGIFRFELTLPMALGTVGGLTSLHPMAKTTLEILGQPDAKELMQIVAVVGLAQNFGALRSLTTTGIQQGHMKMHLLNILNQLEASDEQIAYAKDYFTDKTVTFSNVRDLVNSTKHLQ